MCVSNQSCYQYGALFFKTSCLTPKVYTKYIDQTSVSCTFCSLLCSSHLHCRLLRCTCLFICGTNTLIFLHKGHCKLKDCIIIEYKILVKVRCRITFR